MLGWFKSTPAEPLPPPPTLAETLASLANAAQGYTHLYNDQLHLASRVFSSQSATSPVHALGHAVEAFIAAMLGFEEYWLQEAGTRLVAAETLAQTYSKRRKAHPSESFDFPNELAVLQYDMIAAECDLMYATILFLKESMMDYAKGVYRVRRAYNAIDASWKVLQAHKGRVVPAIQPVVTFVSAGLSFGKGLFELLLSLLPTKASKMLATVGYYGSRTMALSQLRQAIAADDSVHTAISAIALLTFHTGVVSLASYRPREREAIAECDKLLVKMRAAYPMGRLWRLMDGRLYRIKKDLDHAMLLYNAPPSPITQDDDDDVDELAMLEDPSESSTKHLMQLEYGLKYEYAWCLILAGEYDKAAQVYDELSRNTNWSRAFYTYMQAICLLATSAPSRHKQAYQLLANIQPLLKKYAFVDKLIPAEVYVRHKSIDLLEQHAKQPITTDWPLPLFELSFIWNAFSLLDPASLVRVRDQIVKCQARNRDEEWIRSVLEGCIERELGNYQQARIAFKRVIEAWERMKLTSKTNPEKPNDPHMIALAFYEMAVLHCVDGKWEDAEEVCKILLGESTAKHRATGIPLSAALGSYDFEGRLGIRARLLNEAIMEGKALEKVKDNAFVVGSVDDTEDMEEGWLAMQ